MAEWSKALELGILISSPKGRGFEPLRCHSRDRSSFFYIILLRGNTTIMHVYYGIY